MPTTYHAIPAAVLDALGGLHESDPPAVMAYQGLSDTGPWFTELLHPFDGHDGDIGDDSWLLLPQSAPALAAVQVRHLGADTVTITAERQHAPDAMLTFATHLCRLAENAAGRPEGTWTPREVTL